MDMKIDSKFLKKERKDRAWSQQHLADAANLSLRTVQRIENTGNASPESIKAIAAAFDLKPQDIAPSPNRNYFLDYSHQSRIFVSAFFAISILVIYVFLFTANNLVAETDEQPPTKSVLSWLSEVDSERYVESWNQAAPLFQKQLSSNDWNHALTISRKPLGKKLSRKVISSNRHSSLPGVPQGDYFVFLFATSFENKVKAVETVTVTKLNNEWKVIGYFIK